MLQPPPDLLQQVWPEVDDWLTLQLQEGSNGVEKTQTAKGTLRLFQYLRGVLLQDSVLLRKRWPSLAVWQNAVFNQPEYLQYAANLEKAMADAVQNDPANIRLEAAMPDLSGKIDGHHNATLARLTGIEHYMKTSLPSLDDLSVIAQQLQQIKRAMEGGLRFAAFSPNHTTAGPQAPPSPPFAITALARDGQTTTAADIAAAQADVGGNAAGATANAASAAAVVVDGEQQSTYVRSSLVANGGDRSVATVAAVGSGSALQREYTRMLGASETATVHDLWREWTVGQLGRSSVETMDGRHGPGKWCGSAGERKFYDRRARIIKAVRAHPLYVPDTPLPAVRQLEAQRGSRSLHALAEELLVQRGGKSGGGKGRCT